MNRKRILSALTAVLITTGMSLGLAMPAQAASGTDVYNVLASHKNANGQSTPVNDPTLRNIAQAYANELARQDTGTAPSSSNPFPATPAGYRGGIQIQGTQSKGDFTAITEGWKAKYSSVVLNPNYNYLGTGLARGKSGAVYIVANYAQVVPPAPVAAPLPAPAQAPVQAPINVPVPAPVPVVPEPAPAVVEPAPAPKPEPAPAPVVKKPADPAPAAIPTPTATATPTPTPSATASASPAAVQATEKAEEVERAQTEILEAERVAAQKEVTRTGLGAIAYGSGGIGFLALLLLPFQRVRKNEPEVAVISHSPADEDDDDDDWSFGVKS